MASMVRISHYVSHTRVLGPGKRFVIWFQGCQKRCPNCINPDGQRENGGSLVSVDQLFSLITKEKDIQGVTISGGEPFLQFDQLKELVGMVRKGTKLDLMLYSGYTLEELEKQFGRKDMDSFLRCIDIFIDGEYKEELDTGSMYRGSDNQKIYFFTERYGGFEEQIYKAKNREIEFNVTADDEMYLIGIPPKGFYRGFLKNIGEIR